MALTDLTLAECRDYRPELPEPDDLDSFWAATLAGSPAGEPDFQRADTGLKVFDTLDVTFAGFAGDPVRAWLTLPAGSSGRLPCVVEYLGYSGGRGLAHERTLWAAAGYAHLVMDTRGEGWSGSGGDTPDPSASGLAGVSAMTRGIADPDTYLYRRIFTDGVRAVDAARAHPRVDPQRIIVTGASQGGGITLAVSGLAAGLAGAMPDVPFLCDFPRSVAQTERYPYAEIAEFLAARRNLAERVYRTLSYVDAAILARRATAPALFSVAMMDPTCLPSTVFAAFHNYGGARDIVVYEHNGHEGGGAYQQARQLAWVRSLLG